MGQCRITRSPPLWALATTSVLALSAWSAAQASVPAGLLSDLSTNTAERVELSEADGARYQTGPHQTLEIVFADGSSLLLGPNATVSIERFRFDEASGEGALEVTLLSGEIRFILGRMHGAPPLLVNAGDAGVRLQAGGAQIALEGDEVRATLLFEGPLQIEANGGETRIVRPGFQSIVAHGSRPTAARRGDGSQEFAALLASISASRSARGDAAGDDNDVLGTPPIVTPDFVRTSTAEIDPGAGITLGGSAQLFTDQLNQGLSGNGEFSSLAIPLGQQPILLQGGVLVTGVGGTPPTQLSQSRTTNRLAPLANTYAPADGGNARLRRTNGIDTLSYVLGGPVTLPAQFFSGITPPYDEGDVQAVLQRLRLYRDDDNNPSTPATYCVSQGCAEFEDYMRLLLLHQDDLKVALGLAAGRSPLDPASSQVPNLAATNQVLSIPREVLDGGEAGLVQRDVSAIGLRVVPGLSPTKVNGIGGIAGSGLTSDLAPSDALVSLLQSGFNGEVRTADHFLYVEASIDGPEIAGFPELPDIERFVFATGGLGARTAGDTIDRYVLLRGLGDVQDGQSPLSGGLAGARAFAPGETAGFNAFTATDLYIANSTAAGGQNALLQADLGFTADGGASSISATFGALIYSAGDAQVLARTIGSSRDNAGAVSILSPLTNTSFGGGNLWNGDEARAGYAGYLVLENIAEKLPPPDAHLTGSDVFKGGVTTPLGGEAEAYGLLRLAVGDTSLLDTNSEAMTFGGFAAGLMEVASGDAVSVGFLDTGAAAGDPGRFSVRTDASTNRVAVDMRLRGADGADFTAYELGGLDAVDSSSAFVRSSLYGAASSGEAEHALALLTGDELNPAIGSYSYVQWGYFFGDLHTTSGAHVHLGSWAAGEILSPTNYALLGDAHYSGHAIGSAVDDAGVREVQGSFTQSWNFDARSGTMTLSFDGQAYLAPELAFRDPTTDLRYTGLFEETAGRAGQIDGVLVGETPGSLPGGTVGQFGIQNLPGQDGYIASGTFGGDIDPGS